MSGISKPSSLRTLATSANGESISGDGLGVVSRTGRGLTEIAVEGQPLAFAISMRKPDQKARRCA